MHFCKQQKCCSQNYLELIIDHVLASNTTFVAIDTAEKGAGASLKSIIFCSQKQLENGQKTQKHLIFVAANRVGKYSIILLKS